MRGCACIIICLFAGTYPIARGSEGGGWDSLMQSRCMRLHEVLCLFLMIGHWRLCCHLIFWWVSMMLFDVAISFC